MLGTEVWVGLCMSRVMLIYAIADINLYLRLLNKSKVLPDVF